MIVRFVEIIDMERACTVVGRIGRTSISTVIVMTKCMMEMVVAIDIFAETKTYRTVSRMMMTTRESANDKHHTDKNDDYMSKQ